MLHNIRFPELPPEMTVSKGRDVRQGYQRGYGLRFGDLADQIRQNPVYQQAMLHAEGRSVQSEMNRMNLFLIIAEYLAQVPFGHIVEFGAYRGGSSLFMASVAKQFLPGVKVFAFDTFEGMPPTDASIDLHSGGDFAETDAVEIQQYAADHGIDNLELIKGRFEDTVPAALPKIRDIALCHIDCDIKSAVAYSYEAARPAMVNGGYFVFDDALFPSCMGATEVVEEAVIQRDGKLSEQIFPHFVFRAHM